MSFQLNAIYYRVSKPCNFMYASNELYFRHIFQETQFLHVGCWCCDVCCDIIICYTMLHCVVLCRTVLQVVVVLVFIPNHNRESIQFCIYTTGDS